jgi:hypothetical protein
MYSVYGDRSEMSRKFDLKLSHAGKKMQHASKAIGMYVPAYKAIGVTYSDQKAGTLTLSHEYAHFFDNYLGEEYNFASDKNGSTANTIANEFRKNMVKGSKKDGYWGRTCECFARAMEQYYDIEKNENSTGGEKQYMENSNFNEKLKPLVEQFFKENDHLLKAIKLDI